MAGRFSNKLALVAGGTGGLGRAVSLAFLEEGASVAVTFRRQEEFDALKESAGPQASSLIVNTVGGYKAGMKFWEQDPKVLDQMLSLNLRSGYALARAVVPVMLKQGTGAIVNIAARAAIEPPPAAAAYAASKAAASAIMNSLAADLKGTAVRVNSVL